MFNTPAIVNLIQNSLIVIALLWLRRWLKYSGIRLSMQQSQGISAILVDKKQFWERVLIDQDIRQASVVINATELSQEVNNTHHSPKHDSIREPWFIDKFFMIYCMTNYCHLFMLARLSRKEWRSMLPRDRLNYWQSLMLPLLCYQFIAYLSYQWGIALLLLMPLIAALNLLTHLVTTPNTTGLEQSMNYTCLHISQLHDHFPRESMNDSQLYQNLTRYAFALQSYQEHTWVFGLFIFSFMLCVSINDIEWLFIFGWILGALAEQVVRCGILIVYSKRLAKLWMLNPVDQYTEMTQLSAYYNTQLPIVHRSSPKKYVITHDVDVSCFAKEQSNGMLIHQSTNEVIRKPPVLRVTSSNVGEDTHMDMTIEQDMQIQPTQQQQQQQSDSNPEGGIFKKKHHRVKLESLYLSKQRSPTEVSKRSQKSPIEFNPIEILQNLSPIGSLNPSSQREQFPHRWEGEQHNDNIETISNYVSPKGQPLKIISNQIQISNSGMRRNSYKTSKEEEEHSYKENRKIRIQSLSKKRSPQQPQERRKSTNTKVRGESVRGDSVKVRGDSVKVRGDSVKVRGDSVKVRASSQLKSDIPILNFDSARFKEQQPSQRTQRKNQSSTNKKRMQQILQVYENNQTSNENRS